MTLGVIGGLGPLATAYYMELITRMTEAKRDQDHLDIILYSRPGIPDRTAYILGRSPDNPVGAIIDIGQRLAAEGADLIGIPCITAHYFHRELSEAIPVPIIHAIRETAAELARAGVRRAGILATDGTVESGLFQREFAQWGIEPVLPDGQRQRDVMSLIYEDVKAGRPADMERFGGIRGHLESRGAETVVLGCTELSLIRRDHPLGPGILDVLEVLARCSVLGCGGRLREEYRELVTK